MNTKDLIRLGVPVGEPIKFAHEFIQIFIAQGNDGALLEGENFNIVANPPAFFADELRAPMARNLFLIPRHRRRVGDAGHDAVEVFPVSARGAFLHIKAKQRERDGGAQGARN